MLIKAGKRRFSLSLLARILSKELEQNRSPKKGGARKEAENTVRVNKEPEKKKRKKEKMLLGKPLIPMMTPQLLNRKSSSFNLGIKSMATDRTLQPQRRPQTMSPFDARLSLLSALAIQSFSLSQRVLADLAAETGKYVFPKRFESRNLEEALMAVPDLETVNFKVLSRKDQYEIREVEPYHVAETTMPGKKGFDFVGASQSFNVLAEYLFGKNIVNEKMEMTTPVITRRTTSAGEKMEMTTPVIARRAGDDEKWEMSFVMPSKYGDKLPIPKDPSVRIKKVPKKIVAVVAFSGNVTDEEVKRRELKLRDALKNDEEFQVKEGALVEVAQYNPPFTLPFTRRNEISLEVERKQK